MTGGTAIAFDGRVRDGDHIHFDIASQELAAALRLYADQTGKSVFFDVTLATGKRSASLQGDYSAEVALALLLQGSGLSVKNTSDSAFTLVGRESGETAAQAAPMSADDQGDSVARQGPPPDARRAYLIQAALERALCQGSDTYPGTYRALLRFWFDEQGHVRRGGLLGSTGEKSRDRAIDRALRTLALGPQEPAVATQPVVILLLPRTGGTADVCLAP
ncbi:STN domain-containing protein [Herbaspirillum robiniae]|uniref:STN domain-containing protein n=1 Tax=Herbaspirillum robiniae TaxID=2014887 RepID=UPI003D7710D2